jgi:hypothetical protein
MAEVALEVLRASLGEPARRLLEAAADVARRLGHDRLAVEHLLVAGAEDGDPAIARVAGHLAAFREALLDLLYSDRARFKQRGGARGGARTRRARAAPARRGARALDRGEGRARVLEGLLRARSPRVGRRWPWRSAPAPRSCRRTRRRSSASARRPRLDRGRRARGRRAGRRGRAPDGRVVPLTTDLCRDTLEDLPLVGRRPRSSRPRAPCCASTTRRCCSSASPARG